MSNNEGKKLYQKWFVWVLFYPVAIVSFAIEKIKAGEKKQAYAALIGGFVITVLALVLGGTDGNKQKMVAEQVQLTPEQIVEKEKKEALAKRVADDRGFLLGFINASDKNLAFKVTQDLTANRDEVEKYNKNISTMNQLIKDAPGKIVTDWVCETYTANGGEAETRFACFSTESSSLSSKYIEFVVSISAENAKAIGKIYKDDKFFVNGVVSKVTNEPVTFSPEYKNQTASIVKIYIDNGSVALKK